MAALAQTAASFIPSVSAQYSQEYVFGATIAAGQPCYVDASNLLQLCISNGTVLQGTCRGLAHLGGAAGQKGKLVVSDPDLVIGSTTVIGDNLWVFTTAGTYTKTPADLGSGKLTCHLGVAKSTTVVDFAIKAATALTP